MTNTNIWTFWSAIRQSKLTILTLFDHGRDAKRPKKEEQRDNGDVNDLNDPPDLRPQGDPSFKKIHIFPLESYFRA